MRNNKGFVAGLVPIVIILAMGLGAWIQSIDFHPDKFDVRSRECTMVGTFNQDGLAPRPVSFPPLHDKFWEQLAESFQMTHPGQEIWFVKGHVLPITTFERIPWVTYRGYQIYARRFKGRLVSA